MEVKNHRIPAIKHDERNIKNFRNLAIMRDCLEKLLNNENLLVNYFVKKGHQVVKRDSLKLFGECIVDISIYDIPAAKFEHVVYVCDRRLPNEQLLAH